MFLNMDVLYVEGNTGEYSWIDMYLMSLCKGLIIPNSTFSWWGAWLNKHEDKCIIAPHKWFSLPQEGRGDIIPESWTVM